MQSIRSIIRQGTWATLLAVHLAVGAEPDHPADPQSPRPVPPAITVQPKSQQIMAGANVQFTVGASGTPLLTYQWYVNGIPFSGATGEALIFSDARSSDAGVYSVRVTNAFGTVTSNPVTLTVNPTLAATPTSAPAASHGRPRAWFYLGALALLAVLITLARPPARRAAAIFLHSE